MMLSAESHVAQDQEAQPRLQLRGGRPQPKLGEWFWR